MKISSDPKTFAEFWPFYLQQHSHPWTRRLHVLGTLSALTLLGYLIYCGHWDWLGLVLPVGYAFAWFSHFTIEKNRPATFRFPLWSFLADFRLLYYFILRKKMDGPIPPRPPEGPRKESR